MKNRREIKSINLCCCILSLLSCIYVNFILFSSIAYIHNTVLTPIYTTFLHFLLVISRISFVFMIIPSFLLFFSFSFHFFCFWFEKLLREFCSVCFDGGLDAGARDEA